MNTLISSAIENLQQAITLAEIAREKIYEAQKCLGLESTDGMDYSDIIDDDLEHRLSSISDITTLVPVDIAMIKRFSENPVVVYHSERWYEMVENNWTTQSVNDRGIATMVRI